MRMFLLSSVNTIRPLTGKLERQKKKKLLDASINIILHIRPDNILGTLHHTRPLMQQCALCLAMREDRHTTHNGLDRISIDNTFLHTRDEEGRLTALKVVVE